MSTTQMKPEERAAAGVIGVVVAAFAFVYGGTPQKVVMGSVGLGIILVALLGRSPLASGAKE